MAAFAAGISEELLTRFFLMTVTVLLLLKIFHLPRKVAVWSAIFLIALVFAAGHLPATAELVELTPLVLIRAFLLNGIGGVVFGFLYWKKGLESAIVAHIFADVLLYGLFPFFI